VLVHTGRFLSQNYCKVWYFHLLHFFRIISNLLRLPNGLFRRPAWLACWVDFTRATISELSLLRPGVFDPRTCLAKLEVFKNAPHSFRRQPGRLQLGLGRPPHDYLTALTVSRGCANSQLNR
jgi:hypothetical protein